MRHTSRKLCRFLCFHLALLHSVSQFFFFYWAPFLSLCMVFDSISSNISEVLSIYPSTNVFIFGDFIIHHKDWLIYSGGTDRFGKLLYNFSPTTLLRGLNFLFRSQTFILIVQLFWICFFLLILVFVLQYLSFQLGNSDHVVVSGSIDFLSNLQQDSPFYCIAYVAFKRNRTNLVSTLLNQNLFQFAINA